MTCPQITRERSECTETTTPSTKSKRKELKAAQQTNTGHLQAEEELHWLPKMFQLPILLAFGILSRKSPLQPQRPPLVQEALAKGEQLYYFGLGSNMLRSKVENRGVNGTKIDIITMEAAAVPGHRLAFNMRGFPPLEPGMGSLEPCSAESKPLNKYDNDECHGALILLTPENYEKVMQSEGVGPNVTNPGYEEIVVEAYPYKSPNKPVKAIALRARKHVRVKYDPAPSQRYMNILREGASELELKPCYQRFLAQHPTQNLPPWLRRLAVNNLIGTFTLSRTLKTRFLSRLQSVFLFWFHRPKATGLQNCILNMLSALVLLPGALLGSSMRTYLSVAQKEMPPMMARILKMMEEPPALTGETNNGTDSSSTANERHLASSASSASATEKR